MYELGHGIRLTDKLSVNFDRIILSLCSANLDLAGLLERSGSMVECLTRDREAAGSRLTDVTVLCP